MRPARGAHDARDRTRRDITLILRRDRRALHLRRPAGARRVQVPALHQALSAHGRSRSTTTSAACSTVSTRRASPTTPSSSTPPTRASSSASTAGSTSASCTRRALQMPFLVRYPAAIAAGSTSATHRLQRRLRPDLPRLCRRPRPELHAGTSLRPVLRGRDADGLAARSPTTATGCTTTSIHEAWAHYGVRDRPLQAHLLVQRRPRPARRPPERRPAGMGALRLRGRPARAHEPRRRSGARRGLRDDARQARRADGRDRRHPRARHRGRPRPERKGPRRRPAGPCPSLAWPRRAGPLTSPRGRRTGT